MSMWDSETIQTPYGLSVCGSASVKASPDSALITAAITRVEKRPSASFAKAREGSRTVAKFLRKSSVKDFGTSLILVSQEWRRDVVGNESRLLGYRATVNFTIMIKPLNRFEEIVSGAIKAGANAASIEFRTSKLKDLRMQARRLAIEAAKEKATTFSEAAGVSLGRVIHIQEIINAERWGQSRVQMQVQSKYLPIDDDGEQTLDPGAIELTAGVLVAFSLKQQKR